MSNSPDPHSYKLDIPEPFKMALNAWEVGYYDGYTGALDQRFWSSKFKLHRDDYRSGWCEGKDYKILETLAKAHRRRRTPQQQQQYQHKGYSSTMTNTPHNIRERNLVAVWVLCNVLDLSPKDIATIRGIIDDALVRERGEGETQRRHRERIKKQNREDPDLLWEDGD